ncbi:hypothetical protein GN956_G5765 [Arapaima gigas]
MSSTATRNTNCSHKDHRQNHTVALLLAVRCRKKGFCTDIQPSNTSSNVGGCGPELPRPVCDIINTPGQHPTSTDRQAPAQAVCFFIQPTEKFIMSDKPNLPKQAKEGHDDKKGECGKEKACGRGQGQGHGHGQGRGHCHGQGGDKGCHGGNNSSH